MQLMRHHRHHHHHHHKSIPACTSLGCAHDKPKKSPYPIDYKVPDYGIDHDIKDSLKHLKDQEKKHGKWDLPKDENVDISSIPACTSIGCAHDKKPKDPHPMNYYVPNFGVDHDIQASLKNLKDQEKKHGEWKIPKSEDIGVSTDLRMESDPICNSSGCTQYKHPKGKDKYPTDYPVPNFGVDHDILSS